MYDLYSASEAITFGDEEALLIAQDYATMQELYWTDRAHMIADRLGVAPTWYRMATVEQIDRCKAAYKLWKHGTAQVENMVDAMNYCAYQADIWSDEKAILDEMIQATIQF